MKIKKITKVSENNSGTDELTLEAWRRECQQMDEETAQSNAEIREIMENLKSDPDVDPEVRQTMLEVGERILGMDAWVKEFQATTSEIIAKCDAFIAKADRLEKKAAGRKSRGKGVRK